MDRPLEDYDAALADLVPLVRQTKERLWSEEPRDVGSPLAHQRALSSRTTYLELADAQPAFLAQALRAWVRELTLDRVLWPDWVRYASARAVTTARLRESSDEPIPLRELLRRMLRETDGARVRVMSEAFARAAGPVQDAARILCERRVEALQLLDAGQTVPSAPCDERRAEVIDAAEELLLRTEGLCPRVGTDWSEALSVLLCRGAHRGWPPRLHDRWLFDLFFATKMFHGVRFKLRPLPQVFGATSFSRGLSSLGLALADAGCAKSPFVTRRGPHDVGRFRRAALFGALSCDPHFHHHRLGLSRGAARSQAREVFQSLVLWLRLSAAVVLWHDEVPFSRGSLERFEEQTARALGAPMPRALAGVIPRVCFDGGPQFLGSVLSALDRRRLIELYDEDWFRNPRAVAALREEDETGPARNSTPEEIRSAMGELLRLAGELGD